MSKPTRQSTLFERLKKGLEETIQFAHGEINLRTTLVVAGPPSMSNKDIVRLRRRFRMSQGVFAKVVNVSAKTVQSWEQGERKPSQASLRLLQILAENPDLVHNMVGGGGVKSKPPATAAK